MSDFLDLHDDHTSRRVLYLVAVLLVALPLVQGLMQIWPLQLTNIQWRFGAANALSGILLLPVMGLSLLLVMARGLGSTVLARMVGIVASLFTVSLLASLVVFGLDAQQLKTIVSSQMSAAFNVTTIRVGMLTVVFIVAYAFIALMGFMALPGSAANRPAAKRAASAGVRLGPPPPMMIGGCGCCIGLGSAGESATV